MTDVLGAVVWGAMYRRWVSLFLCQDLAGSCDARREQTLY
jgi:hypothetical protein